MEAPTRPQFPVARRGLQNSRRLGRIDFSQMIHPASPDSGGHLQGGLRCFWAMVFLLRVASNRAASATMVLRPIPRNQSDSHTNGTPGRRKPLRGQLLPLLTRIAFERGGELLADSVDVVISSRQHVTPY